MIELREDTTPYLAHFERRRAMAEPDWLRKLRTEAMGRFSALGFPTTHDEDWKYTNVSPIADSV
jgi:Fe-S cluster assembly protein SufD